MPAKQLNCGPAVELRDKIISLTVARDFWFACPRGDPGESAGTHECRRSDGCSDDPGLGLSLAALLEFRRGDQAGVAPPAGRQHRLGG